MAKYVTKQRKELLSYFLKHPDETLSAAQIAKDLDENISISAIYRNLADLETDGLVKRVSKAGTREIFYQYTDIPSCRAALHMSCKCCGKTFHMNIGDTAIISCIAGNTGFSLDKSQTVLYGICKACQKA